jgi:hypothetical protein
MFFDNFCSLVCAAGSLYCGFISHFGTFVALCMDDIGDIGDVGDIGDIGDIDEIGDVASGTDGVVDTLNAAVVVARGVGIVAESWSSDSLNISIIVFGISIVVVSVVDPVGI